MFFKYANVTTCIRLDNLAAITQSMTQLLEQEQGCSRISKPPQQVIDLEQLFSHPEYIVGNLWMIGLFPGDNGWSIVKTWPYNLFCKRAAGASRCRLSALAMLLGCDTFHFWVHRSVNGILLEADAKGQIFTSGCVDIEEGESYQFYDEPINAPGMMLNQFHLLQVPQAMQEAMRVNDDPEIARREDEFERLLAEDSDSELLVYLDDEVAKGYAERIDNALAKIIDRTKSCWYLLKLVYYAYTKPEQLEEKGAQLLYFQPPTTYNPHPVILLPPEPLSEDDEDESF